MPKELNPLLHSQLRLGVMSILRATSLSKKDLKGNAPAPLAASLLKGRLLSKSMSIR